MLYTFLIGRSRKGFYKAERDREMILLLILILGPIRNLQWEKGIEERVGNVLTLTMMNWILWTPALIQMLPVVAGMF